MLTVTCSTETAGHDWAQYGRSDHFDHASIPVWAWAYKYGLLELRNMLIFKPAEDRAEGSFCPAHGTFLLGSTLDCLLSRILLGYAGDGALSEERVRQGV